MTATILPFPRPPEPARGIIIPIRPAHPVPLPSSRDLALGNLRKAYHGARLGNPKAREVVEIFALYAGDEEIAKLAQMLLGDLDQRAVIAPCDCEPDGAA